MNKTNFESDAYLSCKNDTFGIGCGRYLEDEDDALYNMVEWIEDSDNILNKDERLQDIKYTLKDGTTDQRNALLHQYHLEIVTEGIIQNKIQMKVHEQKIIKDFAKYLLDEFDPRVEKIQT